MILPTFSSVTLPHLSVYLPSYLTLKGWTHERIQVSERKVSLD